MADREWELNAMGCMLYEPMAMFYGMDVLTDDYFSQPDIRAVFAELREWYTSKGRFSCEEDVPFMANSQTAKACIAGILSISNWQKGIDRVREVAICHRAAAIGLEIASGNKTHEQILSLSGKLSELITGAQKSDLVQSMSDVAGKVLMSLNDQTDRTIKTGLPNLDKLLSIQPGQMVVIGGRPSAGKTALSLQLALHMASHGKKVCYFSYETSQEILFQAMMANWGQLDYGELVFKRRPPQDLELAKIAAELAKLPIALINAGGKSVGWVKNVAAMEKADVVIVDYLQLMPSKGNSRYEQVTNISMALHTLAQTSGKLVIALAQLNRGGAEAPTMADLKESGQIEQDADAVILLANHKDENGECERYDFVLAKNKRGITGDLSIWFEGRTQTFCQIIRE